MKRCISISAMMVVLLATTSVVSRDASAAQRVNAEFVVDNQSFHHDLAVINNTKQDSGQYVIHAVKSEEATIITNVSKTYSGSVIMCNCWKCSAVWKWSGYDGCSKCHTKIPFYACTKI